MKKNDHISGVRRRDIFGGLGLAGLTLALTSFRPAKAVAQMTEQTTTDPYKTGARINPGDVQILFADLQVSLVAGAKTLAPEAVGRAAGVLAEVGTILKLPMLFSVVPEGSNPPTLVPELRPFATDQNTILRKLASPFMDEPTTAALAQNGRKTLVIAGFSAEVVVLQAGLDALAAGYRVYYVIDAVAGRSERTEAAVFRALEQAGATPIGVSSLTTRMTPDFFSSPGSETFKAILKLRQQ